MGILIGTDNDEAFVEFDVVDDKLGWRIQRISFPGLRSSQIGAPIRSEELGSGANWFNVDIKTATLNTTIDMPEEIASIMELVGAVLHPVEHDPSGDWNSRRFLMVTPTDGDGSLLLGMFAVRMTRIS